MKYVDEFRDGELAKGLAAAIAREADPARRYAFMEFCGGHTHAISRYGVTDLLPANVRMIHGPGCPVCVLPIGRVDQAIRLALDGFIGPAHVSTIIGSRPYAFFAEEYRKPVVIAGFEPLDVVQAIRMLIRQVNEGRAVVENEFTRAVTAEGNTKAQALVSEVFELRRSFEWRGLGQVPYSALRIRAAYRAFDAEARYGLAYAGVPDNKACECGAILRGVKRPTDCKLFGTVCTPENPMGSCMVSSEGACAAHYTYGRFKDVPVVVA